MLNKISKVILVVSGLIIGGYIIKENYDFVRNFEDVSTMVIAGTQNTSEDAFLASSETKLEADNNDMTQMNDFFYEGSENLILENGDYDDKVRKLVLRPNNMVISDENAENQRIIGDEKTVLSILNQIETLPIYLSDEYNAENIIGYRYNIVFFLDETELLNVYIWSNAIILNHELYYYIEGEQLNHELQELMESN